jgi:hypothetical protein
MKNSILAIILCCSVLCKISWAEELPLLIYWDSAEGKALRSRISKDADYWQLSSTFTLQNTQTFCAVASAVTVLNAMPIKKPIDTVYAPFPYFTQNNYFNSEVTQFINPQTVMTNGMTREELTKTLIYQGVNAQSIAGDSLDNESLRTLLQKTLVDDGQFVLANYSRATLGQIGSGHWSILAAFDVESDRVLILDVAKYKYPPVWVEIKTLQQAIATLDTSSQKARGLVIVSQ